MKIVASLSVERMCSESTPLWPAGTRRLIVIASHAHDEDDTLVVHGVDPDAGQGHVVFETILLRARLGAFVKALVDGDPLGAARGSSEDLGAERSIGTDEAAWVLRPDPQHPVRNIAVALAAAIDSDIELAGAGETEVSPPARDDGF